MKGKHTYGLRVILLVLVICRISAGVYSQSHSFSEFRCDAVWQALAGSPGEFSALKGKDLGDPQGVGIKKWKSNLDFAGAKLTTIEEDPGGTTRLKALCYEGDSRKDAETVYRELQMRLQPCLQKQEYTVITDSLILSVEESSHFYRFTDVAEDTEEYLLGMTVSLHRNRMGKRRVWIEVKQED